MKVTLDHRCIVQLADRTEAGARLGKLVSNGAMRCFVVNIGAARMRRRGARPEHYGRFEELLAAAGCGHLPRLDPMFIVDLTFWGKCVSAGDEDVRLARDIGAALFGEAPGVDIPDDGLDSPAGRKWIDRHCDVQTMWTHIRSRNDVYVTTEESFLMESRRPRLSALGVGRICLPGEV